MISKTQISKRTERKKNPEIVNTIDLAKKNNLLSLAKKLSGPLRLYRKINLNELNDVEEDKVLVVGKVLGEGDIERKISVVALGFSKQAEEKLKKAGCEIKLIKDEIKRNPKMENIRILD